MNVGVRVGVLVDVKVRVGVNVCVGVRVDVLLGVRVGVPVGGVPVTVGVGVSIMQGGEMKVSSNPDCKPPWLHSNCVKLPPVPVPRCTPTVAPLPAPSV